MQLQMWYLGLPSSSFLGLILWSILQFTGKTTNSLRPKEQVLGRRRAVVFFQRQPNKKINSFGIPDCKIMKHRLGRTFWSHHPFKCDHLFPLLHSPIIGSVLVTKMSQGLFCGHVANWLDMAYKRTANLPDRIQQRTWTGICMLSPEPFLSIVQEKNRWSCQNHARNWTNSEKWWTITGKCVCPCPSSLVYLYWRSLKYCFLDSH